MEHTKEKVKDLFDKLYSDVIDNLDDLDTKEKAHLLTKLIEYQVPKIRSVEGNMDIKHVADIPVGNWPEKLEWS